MAWASPLSLQGWDGVNQCEGLLRIVTISSGQLNGERNPAAVADQMALAAQLGPVGGTGMEDEGSARVLLGILRNSHGRVGLIGSSPRHSTQQAATPITPTAGHFTQGEFRIAPFPAT
jgi:hypothetical protein